MGILLADFVNRIANDYFERGGVFKRFCLCRIIVAFRFYVFQEFIAGDDTRIVVESGNVLMNVFPEELRGSGKLLRYGGYKGNPNGNTAKVLGFKAVAVIVLSLIHI